MALADKNVLGDEAKADGWNVGLAELGQYVESFLFKLAAKDAIESGGIDASRFERLRYYGLVADLKDVDIIALRIEA